MIVFNVLNQENDAEEIVVMHSDGIIQFISGYGGVKKTALSRENEVYS
jgi:hypothetical protein